MTLLIALKKDDKIWLSSDTRITYGSSVKHDCDPDFDSKIVGFKNALIGAAGDISIRNYLELYSCSPEKETASFETKMDVMKFFIEFKSFLKEAANLGDATNGEVQTTNACWLVVTKDKIFEVGEDSAIIEKKVFGAAGSGEPYAIGALEALLLTKKKMAPAKMLDVAHSIAYEHDSSCGGATVIYDVASILAEKQQDIEVEMSETLEEST